MYNKTESISLTCDNCGEDFVNYNGFSLFVDETQANEDADSDGWSLHNKHYCPSCFTIDDEDNMIIKKIIKNGNSNARVI